MPVSSAAFQWTGEQHSLSATVSRGVDSSSGVHPLTDWTIFGESISTVNSSEESRDHILQQLLKTTSDNESSDIGSNALLRQILSEKPSMFFLQFVSPVSSSL